MKFRKIIAILLTTALVGSFSLPAFAETELTNVDSLVIVGQAMEPSQEKAGLENYLSYNADMTINFDEATAMQDGYAEDVVASVADNIQEMNAMVQQGTATPDENFTVVVETNMLSRATGQSKIVRHWDGRVDYYLNSAESSKFNQYFTAGKTIADAALNALNTYPGSQTLQAMTGILQLYTALLHTNLVNALSHGTGIIMTTQPDSGTLYVWFTYQ